MREKQREIIKALGTRPAINPEEEIENRTRFLADYLGKTGLQGFVLGISGGQDSLLAGILAQRAATLHRHTGCNAGFHAVYLPYGTQADRIDAALAVKTIDPDFLHDFDIKPGVDAVIESYRQSEGGGAMSDFDKGNVKARMRMIAQYAIARPNHLAVIGTDHGAEAVTGFFTKYGDGGADILPLSGLTKRQGKAILQALDAPEIFYTKAPTADLLDANPGQADEAELGMSYDMIDDYLEGREVSEAIAARIEARYDATQHKRELPVAYTFVGKTDAKE